MQTETNILFTGDFYGGYRVEQLVMEEKFDAIFNDFLPIIKGNNIAITNLESPLTTHKTPTTKTGPAIKALPKTVEALKFAGFNLVTLANNHIMDFGRQGLTDTFKNLEAVGIEFLGAGYSFQQASITLYKTDNNHRLAFINIAENEWSTTTGDNPGANPLDLIANHRSIVEARKHADTVFVVLHGGNEMHNLPSLRMRNTCRFFVDSGASAVICHHAHCFSGFEVYNNAPIFYGLGNFLFDTIEKKPESWHIGYSVQFTLAESAMKFTIIPYKQNAVQSGLRLLLPDEQLKFQQQLSHLSEIIPVDAVLEKAFEDYCEEVKAGYNYYLEPHAYPKLYGFQRRGLFPMLLSKKKRRLLKNLVRCESHRDVILKILYNEDSHS